MADVHNKAQRSYNMSRIKGKDTKPEMLVRKFLHAQGFSYKLHDKTLPGKPDVATHLSQISLHLFTFFAEIKRIQYIKQKNHEKLFYNFFMLALIVRLSKKLTVRSGVNVVFR
jgi:DNA mismatch endonuclease Vsr